jgi:hypothetical protein
MRKGTEGQVLDPERERELVMSVCKSISSS